MKHERGILLTQMSTNLSSLNQLIWLFHHKCNITLHICQQTEFHRQVWSLYKSINVVISSYNHCKIINKEEGKTITSHRFSYQKQTVCVCGRCGGWLLRVQVARQSHICHSRNPFFSIFLLFSIMKNLYIVMVLFIYSLIYLFWRTPKSVMQCLGKKYQNWNLLATLCVASYKGHIDSRD